MVNMGRKALVSLIRECGEQIKACDQRAAVYDIRQDDGRCHPIGTHGLNFGSQQWHLGFAAGIQWVQMRLEAQRLQPLQQPDTSDDSKDQRTKAS